MDGLPFILAVHVLLQRHHPEHFKQKLPVNLMRLSGAQSAASASGSSSLGASWVRLRLDESGVKPVWTDGASESAGSAPVSGFNTFSSFTRL